MDHGHWRRVVAAVALAGALALNLGPQPAAAQDPFGYGYGYGYGGYGYSSYPGLGFPTMPSMYPGMLGVTPLTGLGLLPFGGLLGLGPWGLPGMNPFAALGGYGMFGSYGAMGGPGAYGAMAPGMTQTGVAAGGQARAASGASAPASAVRLTIDDTQFFPAEISLPAGTTITWVNTGTKPQTTTSEGNWDSGPIQPGGRWTAVFNVPGTYEYRSTLGPETMRGRLTITAQ